MDKKPTAHYEIQNMFEDHSIYGASPDTLKDCLHFLSTKGIENDRVKHIATVQALTINYILMERHIEKLNKQNGTMQILVIALAIAALISTSVQTYLSYKHEAQNVAIAQEKGSESIATIRQVHKTRSTKE